MYGQCWPEITGKKTGVDFIAHQLTFLFVMEIELASLFLFSLR
jgi:hypothetical protein